MESTHFEEEENTVSNLNSHQIDLKVRSLPFMIRLVFKLHLTKRESVARAILSTFAAICFIGAIVVIIYSYINLSNQYVPAHYYLSSDVFKQLPADIQQKIEHGNKK